MDHTDSTRRTFVTALAGATAAALAGCSNDSSGDGDPTDTGAMDDEMDGTDTSRDDGSTMGGTEDGRSMDGTEDGAMETTFHVVVENVSDGDTLQTMDGSVAVPLSPGVYAVGTGMAHLFAPGETASDGLEALAEDGIPKTLAEEVAGRDAIADSGTFTTPSGMDEAGPLEPGGTYEFSVQASADDDPTLSLATMFVQSNDRFYAPGADGIPLFENGQPIKGDVTDRIALWDAGTEKNQPPGEGGDQAPRQSGPDTGTDEMGSVRRVDEVDDGDEYPAIDEVISVRVSTM